MANGFDPCDFLFERWKNLALWRNLWSILIFLLGASVTVFLAAAVWLYIRQSWLPAVVMTLGTLVNGVASSWVLARRSQAVAEEEEAKKDLIDNCGQTVAAAARGLAPAGGGNTTTDRVNEVEARLRLPGGFR
jgi:hypothetical protein